MDVIAKSGHQQNQSALGDEVRKSGLLALAVGAVGVVYGDIGTSPLYTVKEAFSGSHAVAATQANVFGILSLIFWAVMIVVSLKYVVFVMRADNQGEGGIMALMALVLRTVQHHPRRELILMSLGLFGAALFYGDSVITPAISVLSAVEGLVIATPAFEPFVEPITIAVLIGLFLFQRRGTAAVGKLFGPVMLVWFITLAANCIQKTVQGYLGCLEPLKENGLAPFPGGHQREDHQPHHQREPATVQQFHEIGAEESQVDAQE